MNMNTVDMLLLFDESVIIGPPPPPVLNGWIDNLADPIKTNTGALIVFNVQ